jgi:hypothetical protein
LESNIRKRERGVDVRRLVGINIGFNRRRVHDWHGNIHFDHCIHVSVCRSKAMKRPKAVKAIGVVKDNKIDPVTEKTKAHAEERLRLGFNRDKVIEVVIRPAKKGE